MSTPGTRRSRSKMFAAPERSISSAVITVVAPGASLQGTARSCGSCQSSAAASRRAASSSAACPGRTTPAAARAKIGKTLRMTPPPVAPGGRTPAWGNLGPGRRKSNPELEEVELRDHRQVVARHPRDRQPAAARAEEPDRAAVVDLVEGAGRREGGVGADGRLVPEAVPDRALEAEDLPEDGVELGEPVVEVAGDEAW